MKLAAIDIGSNSIHMVVAEADPRGAFQILDREKEMVRLGAGTLADGRINARAMKRGFATLDQLVRLARSRGADKVVAVATSALREADNGHAFVSRAGRRLGVWPRIISGEQEARLIYGAVVHSVHVEDGPLVAVDIGGGSIELAWGEGQAAAWAGSEKLGVLRMSQRFIQNDPPTPGEVKKLVRHIRSTMGMHAAFLRKQGFARVVGTSGTILALGQLALEMEGAARPDTLHHVTVDARAIRDVRDRLLRMDLRARLKLGGLDPARADIIPTGAVILTAVLELLDAREITLCEWALREGVILDYLSTHRGSLARVQAYPDPRRRSVMALAERCRHDRTHARHVTALALQLFDGLRTLHGLDTKARELLEYAALLHDVGHHISYPAHHRHTYYLIKNGDLRGFAPDELEALALVARYHRRRRPRKSHPGYEALPKAVRRRVSLLAGLLRVADALDRTHQQAVRNVTVSARGKGLALRCEGVGDCELELWGAKRRLRLLERELGRTVSLSTQPLKSRSIARPA
jgi:exopolyphosphatase/guanosine-5'-triphosphate,3'-diphosphate pyrophosphatase